MKSASPELVALINSGAFVFRDCYTIVPPWGDTITLAASEFPISFGGTTWATHPSIDQKEGRATANWKIGLDVDKWKVTVQPRPFDLFTGAAFPDTIGGTPWLQACRLGLLDNAQVTVQRAYFAAPLGYPIPASGAVPTGLLTIFFGLVTDIDPLTTSSATLNIDSMISLIDISMPRNYFQTQCRHVLFDSGCTLNAASFAQAGIAGGASTQNAVVASSLPTPGGSGTYALGRLVFTSGANEGVQTTISDWDGADTLTLLRPLPFPVAAGDTFTAYPGCAKSTGACTAFGNLVNFGGQPYIPVPEAVIG